MGPCVLGSVGSLFSLGRCKCLSNSEKVKKWPPWLLWPDCFTFTFSVYNSVHGYLFSHSSQMPSHTQNLCVPWCLSWPLLQFPSFHILTSLISSLSGGSQLGLPVFFQSTRTWVLLGKTSLIFLEDLTPGQAQKHVGGWKNKHTRPLIFKCLWNSPIWSYWHQSHLQPTLIYACVESKYVQRIGISMCRSKFILSCVYGRMRIIAHR